MDELSDVKLVENWEEKTLAMKLIDVKSL